MKYPAVSAAIAIALLLLVQLLTVHAHCDGLDGPVVQAAEKALATGDVNFVLIWVPKNAETEIRKTFAETLAVRKINEAARQLADTHFFETLVRVHRASEGAGFTGLKARGRDLGPAIPAADKALRGGNADALVQLLVTTIQDRVREHFNEALTKQKFASDDLDAGRAFVKAYVEYIHCVEALYETATHPTAEHYEESENSPSPKKHQHAQTASTNRKIENENN
jgi:Family of unknown function (DUF6448)